MYEYGLLTSTYEPLQINYQRSKLLYLNNQHSWWTRQIIHPPIVTSQCWHLGIGKVVQNPPLKGKSDLNNTRIILACNLCGASHKHSITYTCNKVIHLD